MLTVTVVVISGIMLVGFVVLVLLWAVTEEIPKTERIPFYERLEPGEWGVELERVGRRRMRTIRVINEVLGGDLGAAKGMVDHAPAVVIEGISQELARELVAALVDTKASARMFALDHSSSERKTNGQFV